MKVFLNSISSSSIHKLNCVLVLHCKEMLYLCIVLSAGLDGSTSASERERLINQFNDPENTTTWVFLLSTRYNSTFSSLLMFFFITFYIH